jgi:hypothetical protein
VSGPQKLLVTGVIAVVAETMLYGLTQSIMTLAASTALVVTAGLILNTIRDTFRRLGEAESEAG